MAWQESLDIARGGGERGPWRQNDSRYDFVDDPSVAIDDSGNVAVVWVDQAAKDVFFAQVAAGARRPEAEPINVSRSPATFSWLPRVALDPRSPRRVYLLWQEIIFSGGSHGGDILFARSDDGGRSFTPALNLSRSIGGDGKGRINRDVWHNGSLDLVCGTDGALYAAWSEYDGPLWFSRSSDGGKSFSPPLQVAGGGQALPARAPALAAAPDGAIYLAWSVGETAAGDIQLAKSGDGGASFDPPRTVAATPHYSDAPKLAVDVDGVLHLAYAESSAGPFASYRIRYLRSRDGARSFEPSRELPGTAGGSAFPALSVPGGGQVHLVWELQPAAGQASRGLGLAMSGDSGQRFASPGQVPQSADAAGGVNGSSQGLLMKKLASNRAGALAIVNSSLRAGEHSRVWLMRGQVRSR